MTKKPTYFHFSIQSQSHFFAFFQLLRFYPINELDRLSNLIKQVHLTNFRAFFYGIFYTYYTYYTQKHKRLNFNTFFLASLLYLIVNINQTQDIRAQVTGESGTFSSDSLITFTSPRPLIDTLAVTGNYNNAYGLQILFTNAGFGLGGFYEYKLSESLSFTTDILLSGARNTDEVEVTDIYTGRIFVPYKLNRVYNFPLTFGLRKFLFQDILVENFKPFLELGGGGSFLIANPYSRYINNDINQQEYIGFFEGLKNTITYIRPAAYIGLGSDFGFSKTNISRLSIRYYYIPFLGGNQKDEFGYELKDANGNPIPKGIYSMHPLRKGPITDFGGIFISLSIGTKF